MRFAHARITPRLGPASSKWPARGDDGVAAIEFAIILPVLLLILFSIIDMGRMLQQQIQMTEAAREGARLGALSGTSTDVKNKVQSIVGAGITLNYGATPTLCTSASVAGSDAVVTITRPFQPVTPLTSMIKRLSNHTIPPVTLKATGVMACVG
ncbi:Flp pilus assembly protein TadG [Actinoplanes lutulentus]|uniref:TadE-like protein n=1 Tax=Actinoplanes lutulentus TaxID=1287878 RepID=A0A327ZAV9_9ACTN|nr:TadE/TadG family type IV pilus assembly protein [Actinoplanes lutulentus]MBB2941250.1 Flp pilus assembly protein TadG [Actinoplanes lutulentus]RAK36742.1 TadE-like protein [Actinoplanes lutulentus]